MYQSAAPWSAALTLAESLERRGVAPWTTGRRNGSTGSEDLRADLVAPPAEDRG